MLGLLPRNGCGPDARSLILSASGEGCMRFRVGTAGCGIAFIGRTCDMGHRFALPISAPCKSLCPCLPCHVEPCIAHRGVRIGAVLTITLRGNVANTNAIPCIEHRNSTM